LQESANAGGARISRKSHRSSLGDTVRRIAAVLEAKGWPAQPTGAAATEHQEAAARKDVERARELWAAANEQAERNPAFAPMVKGATSVLDNAQRRLDSAVALREALKDEPDRQASHDEAWRQLCQASRNGAPKARGIFVPARGRGSTADAAPIECELPPPAFSNPGSAQDCRLHNEVNTSWGRYIHVNFDDKETDRIWPMPAADRQDELIIQSERSEPEAGTGTSGVDELAEWVFARYEKERRFKSLYAEAREPSSGIGSFLKRDLLAAYQRVYQTKAHHSPAAGWPMQPEFRRRWHSRKATE
jgi:hypothetical protein